MARPTLEENLLTKAKQLDRKLTDEEKLIFTDEYHKGDHTRNKNKTDALEKEARFNLKASRGRWASEKKHKKYIELFEKYGSDEDINEEIK